LGELFEARRRIRHCRPLFLRPEERVVHLPELVLRGGAHGVLGRRHGVLMTADREIDESEPDFPVVDVLTSYGDVGRVMPHLAVRALKVARDNHPDLRRRIAANARAVSVCDEWVSRRRGGCCYCRCGGGRRGCGGKGGTRRRWRFRTRVLGAFASGAGDQQNGNSGGAEIDIHRTVYRDGVARENYG